MAVSSPCPNPAVLLSTAISQPREQEPQDVKRQAAFSLLPELTRAADELASESNKSEGVTRT